MKRIGILAAGMVISAFTYAQTLNIKAGTSVSNLDWTFKGSGLKPMYGNNLVGYSVFVGLDYLDSKYFNLSTNLGAIRKGGKEDITFYDEYGVPLMTKTEKPTLDYISINTMAEFKYPVQEHWIPFVGIGPRIDYLFHQSSHFSGIENFGTVNRSAFGLIMGGGIKYNLEIFQLGLRANYYKDFGEVASWSVPNSSNGGEVKVHTFDINVSVGYKLN
jgi:hypothetical protein